MAVKVSAEERVASEATGAPAARATAAAEDLAILHPELTVRIGKGDTERLVTVREYGFLEGLQLRVQLKVLLDALYELAAKGQSVGSLDAVEDLFATHHEAALALMAKATDLDPAAVAALSDEDGYHLLSTWWTVNAGFFIRRLLNRITAERAGQRLAAVSRSAGGASITPSSPPGTDAAPQTSAV